MFGGTIFILAITNLVGHKIVQFTRLYHTLNYDHTFVISPSEK